MPNFVKVCTSIAAYYVVLVLKHTVNWYTIENFIAVKFVTVFISSQHD